MIIKNKLIIGIILPADLITRRTFGGASGFIENIINDFNSDIIIYGIGINRSFTWEEVDLNSNAKFITTARLKYPSSIPMRLKVFLVYLLQRRRILNDGADILYIHSPECVLPFLFCNKNVPVVYHQHGSINPLSRSKFAWARKRPLIKLFDYILKLIHTYADWNVAIDRLCFNQAKRNRATHKTSLLMNAVNMRDFHPDLSIRKKMRSKFMCPKDQFVILYAGKLEAVKRVDKLIDCMKYLKFNAPAFRLFLAGNGTLRSQLEEQVALNKLEHIVTFLGQIPHNQLSRYYNMADVLVLPSEKEGVPMVILESLACGTPVIASSIGGIPEIIRNGSNGVLLKEVKAETISGAIKLVKTYQYERQTIKESVDHLRSTLFTQKLEDLFKNIIANQNQPDCN